MKYFIIRWCSCLALSSTLIAPAFSQGTLPPNAAASVNGIIISNDTVEQGIRSALAQGQKDSPELRKAVLGKLIEISLLSQQADKNGLADSEKANRQLALIRQNYLADLE
ncbi:MAG: peptidylprolyl isomerase, partial [Polynucleobacter sp. 24-46-87]